MSAAVGPAPCTMARAAMNDIFHDDFHEISEVSGGWDARLDLAFERRGARTAMVRNAHRGPLVVQKALYPEGAAQCQAVIVHPPGGIAGGDRLKVGVAAGDGAEVLLTTPGATRWYRSAGRPAEQHVHIQAGGNSIVEWLPLETIVFDGADAQSRVTVDCADDARVAGWEIVVFGRRAAGESFRTGRFRQVIEIRRRGRMLWAEYGEVCGGDPLFESPIGYAGHAVSGLLWLAAPPLKLEAFDVEAAAGLLLPDGMLAGVTLMPDGIMLARCLGGSTEQVKDFLQQLWRHWRPRYAQRAATAPRLWAT